MTGTETYGLISLLPVTVVIVTAIITKRALEPLLLGTLVGFIILEKLNFIPAYLASLYIELGESAYFIIVFGLFGIYTRMLESSNAISGFTNLGLRFAKDKKRTGILTIVTGLILFLDNYFSILGAGVANRTIADENKMSREFFAFTVNVIACATCILVPLSLWGIFMSSQIEDLKILGEGGMISVAKAVPFMFYAWVSVIFVVLYQLKVIKPFGPMSKAEKRAEEGMVLPPDCEESSAAEGENSKTASVWNFAVPMLALIAVTLITKELTYGLLVGIALCFIIFIIQKRITIGGAFDTICRGFEDMFVVTAIVISAFVLQNANDALGLAPFVIDSVSGIINGNLLPVIAFMVLLGLGFITGSFWGMAAVCFPIMLPLADKLDANIYLTIGAVIAGAAAGSTTCFYGDSATLTCGITKIKNIHYARTALPMLVPVIITTMIVYTVAGFIL